MRNKMIVGTTIALATVAALTVNSTSARAYPEDKRVFFTFNAPVAVPGTTLPAGRYMFHLASSIASGERRVIQVLDGNGRTSYAMFFGIPALRSDYATRPELGFMETAAGQPQAVKTWWYPGSKDGYEFLYPKDQFRQLTTAAAVAPTSATAVSSERAEPVAAESTPAAETAAEAVAEPATEPELRAEAASAEPEAQAAEPTPAPAQVSEPAREERTELPRTASQAGAVALGAVGFLCAAAFVRRARVARG